MTKEEFAAHLHENEYRDEMTKEDKGVADTHGLIVIFGASDDLMEFEGALCDEIGAGTARIVINASEELSLLQEDAFHEINDLFEEHNLPIKLPVVEIKSEWCPEEIPGASWLIKTDLPHATFDILEDGDIYCRGIVIDSKDVFKALKSEN